MHARLAIFFVLAACKAGGGFNFNLGGDSSAPGPGPQPVAGSSSTGSSSSPSTGSSSSSSPPAPSAAEVQGRKAEYDAIGKSVAKAEAYFKRYGAADIKAACGWNVTTTIDLSGFTEEISNMSDSPGRVVGEDSQYAGEVMKVIKEVCSDQVGKDAIKGLRALHIEKIAGKAVTKPTTRLFGSDKHALDWANGTLTIKLRTYIADGFFSKSLIHAMWPGVEWYRETQKDLPHWQRSFTAWTEDKEGVDFKLDVDMAGFAGANYMYATYLCNAYDSKLKQFLDLLYDKTDKGKQILRKVKRVTCSATTEQNGKVAEVKGDQLIFYGRVLQEHFKASFFLDRNDKLPENDAYFAYALFRKAKNLGGECSWARYAMSKDPEADRLCPE
jgi:hypothetical protein